MPDLQILINATLLQPIRTPLLLLTAVFVALLLPVILILWRLLRKGEKL